jgi:tetratricopeptide (TPR) repeat protein
MTQMEGYSKMVFLNLGAVVCIGLLAFAASTTLFKGLSQYFVYSGSLTKSEADIEKAISFDSTNPNAFELRGTQFLESEKYLGAADNFRAAIKLRPNSYINWLRLGYCSYKVGDIVEAKNAYEASILLAPNYSKPNEYMGRLLLQLGENEKAFSYLSKSAAIDDALLPEIFDLAYKMFPDDPVAIENAANPTSMQAKKSLALNFISHRLISDKFRSYMLDPLLENDVKNEFISKLIEMKDYELAFDVWSSKTNIAKPDINNLLVNGDFETEIDPEEIHFGWVVDKKLQNIVINADTSKSFSKKVCLQFIFDGNSDSRTAIISQLVPVKPLSAYHLQFAAQAQDVVTGGLPVIEIIDAHSGKQIVESHTITNGNWIKYAVDFSTMRETHAVIINFKRKKCETSQCPIFGQVWLDNFMLK